MGIRTLNTSCLKFISIVDYLTLNFQLKYEWTKVIGRESNHSGIGTRVTVVPSENDKTLSPFINKQIREVQGGKGSGSQHSLTTEFGLGIYDGTIDIEARFPSGKIKTLENVKTNQLIIIEE